MKSISFWKPVVATAVLFTLAGTGPVVSAASRADLQAHPGYVDLGEFAPAVSGGEFVEVNLGKALIRFAATVAAKEEPELAELLAGIEAVRVNVVTLDESNRDAIQERAGEIARTLAERGWERAVRVQDAGENVHIYARTAEDGAIQGLTIVVAEEKGEAVFVNIVGHILPDQVATVAESLDIEPLRHLKTAAGDARES